MLYPLSYGGLGCEGADQKAEKAGSEHGSWTATRRSIGSRGVGAANRRISLASSVTGSPPDGAPESVRTSQTELASRPLIIAVLRRATAHRLTHQDDERLH